MRADQIALQLYTVRGAAAENLGMTLDRIAAAGYGAVELAGLSDVPAGEVAELLAASGLRPVAAHVGIETLRAELAVVVDRMARIGCPRIIVPWMPESDRQTTDDVRRFADELGILAEESAAADLTVGYHNHAFEFADLDGSTVWDVLIEGLPSTVELELDVYWVSIAGASPVAEIERLGSRIRLLHMKDRAAGAEPHDAPVGQGVLPFPAIVEAGRRAGVDWYIVEQDDAADPWSDIAIAQRHLRSLASAR
jgi:sugar phosphate isomerase/epimerase